MNGALRWGLLVAAIAALTALAAAAFIFSGIYNIGADDHHTQPVLAVIEELRDRSIAVRAAPIEVPDLASQTMIAAGAKRYAALCANCHLAPGLPKSDLRTGLYPHPPNLPQERARDARTTFWIIKHGIKMSAMPAWGKTLDDAAIWSLTAFVRQLPQMTPESFQQLARAPSE